MSLPWVVLADAGYWHTAQMRTITEREIQVRVPLDGNMRKGNDPAGNTASTNDARKLTSDRGRKLYAGEDRNRLTLSNRRQPISPIRPRHPR